MPFFALRHRAFPKRAYRRPSAGKPKAPSLLSQTLTSSNLFAAWEKVRGNGGMAGVDGQTLAAFEHNVFGRLLTLKHQVEKGEYKPLPLRSPTKICLIYSYINSTRSRNMLAVRLPTEIEERLEKLAKTTGRTKTYYVRQAILEYLDDLEDLYLAEQRLIDLRAGKTKAVPLEEVMKRYGMED